MELTIPESSANGRIKKTMQKMLRIPSHADRGHGLPRIFQSWLAYRHLGKKAPIHRLFAYRQGHEKCGDVWARTPGLSDADSAIIPTELHPLNGFISHTFIPHTSSSAKRAMNHDASASIALHGCLRAAPLCYDWLSFFESMCQACHGHQVPGKR